MWKYDTTTNTWTSVAPFPITPGVSAPVSFVLDSIAYVGTGNNEFTGKVTRDFWSYSSTTNTWTSIATLTGVGRWTGVGFAIGNKGYAGTGYDSTNAYLQDYWEYFSCSDTTNNITGISSIVKQTGEINVYPNPNNGNFTLVLSGTSDKSTVEVYNMLGDQVFTYNLALGNNSMEMSSQPNGIYLYRVISETGNLVGQGKMIIQK